MNIYAIKREILISQKGRCAKCGAILNDGTICDLAHILPQRKWLINKYGKDIIHHPLNMKVTCHNDNCNSGVQMSPNKTALVEKHIEMIKEAIENG
jgi:hypothetical protein